jgi:hypothetical protein
VYYGMGDFAVGAARLWIAGVTDSPTLSGATLA